MRRSLVPSANGGGLPKRPALGEMPVQSYDLDPNYYCPSVPAHCIVNGDDVSARLKGDRTCRRFSVIYGRVSTRKHKKWEDDGILVCQDRFALLQTEDGKDVARMNAFSRKQLASLEGGTRLVLGGFELEIQEELKGDEHPSSVQSADESVLNSTTSNDTTLQSVTASSTNSPLMTNSPFKTALTASKTAPGARRKFVIPLRSVPKADTAEDFVINQKEVDAKSGDAVVLEGRIARHLRPHQKEGLTFLYEHLKEVGGGAILADEMGLGKSVQAICVMWVLLKRLKHKIGQSVRFLLITPTSLVGNWRLEFGKWLPPSSSLVYPVTKASDLSKYSSYANFSPVLLMSYEMATRCADELEKTQFALMIDNLRVDRRLLLTGTPLQNDLNEFFSLLDLARPGHFGSLSDFKNSLGTANEDVDLKDYDKLLSGVMLRRTAEVNYNYLPPKHEYILWCRMAKVQRLIYSRVLQTFCSNRLPMIDMLRKLCNHPSILYKSLKRKGVSESEYYLNERMLRAYPRSFAKNEDLIADSGKLGVFVEIMMSLRRTRENIVVVSNFTKTLDLLSAVCDSLLFTVTRLDGSVNASKRMQLVDEFNRSDRCSRVLLLSTRAGGVGLNLVGASRLILFDSDWNPAYDVQAMARIWRDGQKLPCHIYRLVTAGSMDEKVLQRQVKKSGLGTVVDVDSLNEPMTHFSEEDLNDIFVLDTNPACSTHDLMECTCGGTGLLPVEMEGKPPPTPPENPLEILMTQEEPQPPVEQKHLFYEDTEETEGQSGTESTTKDDGSAAGTSAQDGFEEETGRNLSASVLMGALMRWRHYSPLFDDEFRAMKAEAGLQRAPLGQVSFIMKLTSNY